MHTLEGFIRSVSQAQNCEKTRGHSHAAPADHQVGSDAHWVVATSNRKTGKPRYFVSLKIDLKTGEPVEDKQGD